MARRVRVVLEVGRVRPAGALEGVRARAVLVAERVLRVRVALLVPLVPAGRRAFPVRRVLAAVSVP